ncbi:STY4526/YPO1902 family pathogenicity island replication protein [Oceanicoccus sp. KOV_DT_Chl]|uniref:STY4526/YPO1902 family pathogenicity island replication protein n=1 Tax=Oceanicoccus sp. KOV_DT_Chl TaxID=1904639 RepID=UPI000C7A0DDD|nr:STY4526/YPO1902 family pathogenicity island replication protein [Oceanicoccus sp. KOV_DT_Chl]
MRNVSEEMSRAAATTFVHALGSPQLIQDDNRQIPDELILALSKLNLTEQYSLINRAKYFLAVDLNTQALQRQLYELEIHRENHENEDAFLLLGAPLVLMRRLFGMHASEFSRRRHALNLKGERTGRPNHCDEKTTHLIWEQWEKHQHLDERERFMLIAEHLNLSLQTLWSALRSHIQK